MPDSASNTDVSASESATHDGANLPKKGKATPILSVVTVLLVAALGGLGVKYMSDQNSTDQTIADQRAQLETLERDLRTQTESLEQVKQDLAAARNEADQAKRKIDDLAPCLKAVKAFVDATKKESGRVSPGLDTQVVIKCDSPSLVVP